MPSFDIVSEIDTHELQNAIDQTNRELANRFDFKGSNSKVEHEPPMLRLHSASAFQIKQMNEILETKLVKRGIDLRCLQREEVEESGRAATQNITMRQGVDRESARKIVKLIKETKMKVQTSIQGEQLRVSGKKRDDLQAAIALVKKGTPELPLQFANFRD